MKVFVDANLLVYLNTLLDPRLRVRYEEFYIDLLSRYKGYTDVLVLDELIYVSRKKYNVPYSVTLEFIDSVVLPYMELLPLGGDEYRRAAGILAEYGLKPSDALHLAAMENNMIRRLASEDAEFDRVPWVERLWPGG